MTSNPTNPPKLSIVPKDGSGDAPSPEFMSTELIRRHVTDDNICILTFDRPDSTAWGGGNVYDVYTKATGKALDGTKYRDW